MYRFGPAIVLTLLLALVPPVSASPAVPDAGELAAFLDPFVARQLAEREIPGAVVVLVQDGQILHKQGYGYANLERREPIDPDLTLMNIGSITKLFTATAVMQQVEQGHLDLHADVNRYLTAFRVPSTFADPITLDHLLTHTAGFDERIIGWAAPSPDQVEPLAENLAQHLPPRIRPPGRLSQYSNHGISLAGHIVERVSDLTYPDYVAAHIWAPLGMTRTTYQPTPDLLPHMATGYISTTGANQPGQRVYFNVRPAGGIWTTGSDMAAFMLAHLQGGEYQGRRILAASTAAEMHRQQFTAHPALSTQAYGFFEHRAGDRRGLHHGGEDPEGFTSHLYLLPDQGLGIFVSFNKVGGQTATAELIEAILDRYVPVEGLSREPKGEPVDRFAGSYTWIRQDRHTFVRPLLSVMTYRLQLWANADGSLTSTTGLFAFIPETRWIQVEPLLFQKAGGTDLLAFDQDENGRITHLHLGWPQPVTMQRLAWYETSAFHLGLLLFCAASFLSTVGWPIARLYRRLRGRTESVSPTLGYARLCAGMVSGLALLFLVGMPAAMATTFLQTYTVSTAIKAVLWMPITAAALTVPLVILVLALWRNREGSAAVRVHHTVLAAAALLFPPFLYYWRWLGFHF